MDPGKIFQIITNSTLLATRLLPGAGGPIQFSEPRYCVLLPEDAPPAVTVAKVTAIHKEGVRVRYRITGGNRDGLFTINRRSGLITLAAPLDFELHPKHELVVAAEAGGKMVHTIVQVTVGDVNDNPPQFLESDLSVTVVEEDDTGLPATILKVVAHDDDIVDQGRLIYSVGGDGVDGYGARDAYFTINPHTGELIQLRALDRDPPRGRETWRVKVQVTDGQRVTSSSPSISQASYPGSRRRYPRVPNFPQSGQDYLGLSTLKQLTNKQFLAPFNTWRQGTLSSLQQKGKQNNSNGVEFHSLKHIEPSDTVIQQKRKYLERRLKLENRHSNRQNDGHERSEGILHQNRHITSEGNYFTENNLDLPSANRIFGEISKPIYNRKEGMKLLNGTNALNETNNEMYSLLNNYNVHLHVNHSTYSSKKEDPRENTSFINNYLKNVTRYIKRRDSLSPLRFPLYTTKKENIDPTLLTNLYKNQDEMEGIKKNKTRLNVDGAQNSPSVIPSIKSSNFTQRDTDYFMKQEDFTNIEKNMGELMARTLVKRFASIDGGGCQDYGDSPIGINGKKDGNDLNHRYRTYGIEEDGLRRRPEVHVAEAVVTVVVKDINDNAPTFPHATIFGEVQENGPIDLSVAVVSAWDADDEAEGTNALITYSIEKNVIEERSGQAIFAVHPETGLVHTAICCLDRETTPEYHIQVVAVDGGGLKGTVVVRLADINDNSPRLTRELWKVEVNETWASGPPDNMTLVEISTLDHDTSNYFFYRVVESSGWGWEHFAVRTHGTVGQLYANRTLDYEDPAHRRGFRFMVQVTDRIGKLQQVESEFMKYSLGILAESDTQALRDEDGIINEQWWDIQDIYQSVGSGGLGHAVTRRKPCISNDSRHTDTAWVAVQLLDLNDNPPEFRRPHVHITVREDTSPGTLLATLPARDPDMGGQQKVKYHVQAQWGALTVDNGGGVRLWRALDREAPGGEKVIAKVIGVDEGIPSLSSTATLTVTVTDVNDCPPRLLPPTELHVKEGTSSAKLGMLTATDDDVWALGHGPPFNLSLAPTNPKHVLQLLALKYDPIVDSGRGGAEIWTLGAIDREEIPQLTAEIILTDAGGLSTTQSVTVIVDDINDNPMKPAAKTVYLWKMQGGGVDTDIGRVYVNDPDDWDLEDKTFSWAGSPHPLFALNTETGSIYASMHVREGRYELHFSVSDRVWRQYNVSANVTVAVRYLSPEALAHAVPITLIPTTPAEITSGWTPMRGGGGLGLLSETVTKVLQQEPNNVEIVSVYGHPSAEMVYTTPHPDDPTAGYRATAGALKAPFASVWISVRRKGGGYIDPIKLQGLLALHIQQLESVMKVRVLLDEPLRSFGTTNNGEEGVLPDVPGVSDPSSIASMASTSLRLKVVDTNSTSLVTPKLSRALDCRSHIRDGDDSCTANSCLNGGRCVRTDVGNRCICPGGSWGRRCKVLSRTFRGRGWAWVRPLTPCLPTTISLRILTRNLDALLLYSGPLSSTSPSPRQQPTALMVLQLVQGKPQVLIEGSRGPIKLEVNFQLNTGSWHVLHLHLNAQGVTLMVDRCAHHVMSNATNEEHCLARSHWREPQNTDGWIRSVPLQVGGLAHPYPLPHLYGWSFGPVQQGLDGCISHLKINSQLIDLGEPPYSSGSSGKCGIQDMACREKCGPKGHCTGGLREPSCTCDPGWMGPTCNISTIPMTLGQSSFSKVSLTFTPEPFTLETQLRVRTQGRSNGLLMQLSAQSKHAALSIRLRGGVACATLSGAPEILQEVCVEDHFLGDGAWHTLYVTRLGYDLAISVDDGDGWRYNDTLTTFLTAMPQEEGKKVEIEPLVPFNLDMKESVSIGGIPEYVDLNLVSIRHDLTDSCIDDVRISGHHIPLPPNGNSSDWGQVTTYQHIEADCKSPDLCVNTSCLPPLSCHQSWRHTTCSCGNGGHLLGGICQDVDECAYQPCLHGGTCTNIYPGYQCSCAAGTTGYNCEWHQLSSNTQHLTPPMAIAALTLSLLVLVLVGVLLTIWIHRSRTTRSAGMRQAGVESETDVGSVMGVIETPLSTQDTRSITFKDEMSLLESLKMRLPTKAMSPEGNKQQIPSVSSTTIPGGSMKDLSIIYPAVTPTLATSRRIPSTESVLATKSKSLSGGSTNSLSSTKCPQVVVVSGMSPTQPLMPQDDLRAYAYEGDGSPSGSLSSTVLGLRRESIEENVVKPLMPEYGEVLDLLKTLPDAVGSPRVSLEALSCSTKGEREFSKNKEITVIPSGKKEMREAILRTGSHCGIGLSVIPGDRALCGTLPHSVRREPMERKCSVSEFSTLC
ncbi:putative neural-cadherin 2 [Palaemon carinicauda]|uniref:putative neural-cadherin 2 n=1 Tax=Palaemon carinicauda TaxID=392227 RepID=UPI0035B5ECBD